MQNVSKAYKESMKSALRERSYIMVSLGLINQEAQANARITNTNFAYYAKIEGLFKEQTDDIIYATLEENFTKVDETMLFPPRPSMGAYVHTTGLISDILISDSPFQLDIELNIKATRIKGLTVHFGENYPVDFDIRGSTGQVIEIRENTKAKWSMEEVLENTTSVTLFVHRMKHPKSRLRIYSIRFGYGLVYYNDSVMNTSMTSMTSPIGASVPQVDFQVQVKNYEGYYNVDNPKSAIHFLEMGQEMEVFYGYQLPNTNEIEWVHGGYLHCSEWESNDSIATIRAHDVIRNMDGEYAKGIVQPYRRSYYDLAKDVLADAGFSEYYIDPYLKTQFTGNPIPRVSHKAALQMIANACRCTISLTRKGGIRIESNFKPNISITSNGETSYSQVSNVLQASEKAEYTALSTNYTTTDETMYFLSRMGERGQNTGYVSSVQSDESGLFKTNPMLTIHQESACSYYGIRVVFGHTLPESFIIRTYNDKVLVTEREVSQDEISKTTVIREYFDDFNTMELEFTKTRESHNRIVVNHFSFGDITDFTMTKMDMTSSPNAIKHESVKEIIVPYYMYQHTSQEDNLVNEEVNVTNGEIATYYISDAAHRYRAMLNDSSKGVEIIDSGAYFIKIRFLISGMFKLDIYGHRYNIVERYAVETLNNRGKTIKWENPLIGGVNDATKLAKWLGDYYRSGIEYEYNTRGNPEIDAGDVVYQENDFHKDMKVNIYRHTVNFKQTLSGKITARKMGG